MQILSKSVGKRVLVPPIPQFVLRLMIGEFSSVFINGQKVIPGKLIHRGFEFEYPDLQGSLDMLLGSRDPTRANVI